MRISDWSSDVCSSDRVLALNGLIVAAVVLIGLGNVAVAALDGVFAVAAARISRILKLGQRVAVAELPTGRGAVIRQTLRARKSVVSGKSVPVGVDLCVIRFLTK